MAKVQTIVVMGENAINKVAHNVKDTTAYISRQMKNYANGKGEFEEFNNFRNKFFSEDNPQFNWLCNPYDIETIAAYENDGVYIFNRDNAHIITWKVIP